MSDELDRMAMVAVEKRQRRLLCLTLELVLGEMVAMDGVKSVRARLLCEARRLREFHT